MLANSIRMLLSGLAIPFVVLLGGLALASQVHSLPDAAMDALQWLPFVATVLAVILSLLFNQRLALLCSITVAGAYALLEGAYAVAPDQPFLAGLLYAACCVFVPANLLIISLLPDRGLVKMIIVLCGLIAVEAATLAWLFLGERHELAYYLMHDFVESQLLATPLPQLGLLLFAAAGSSLLIRYLLLGSPVSGALALYVIPLGLAAHWANEPSKITVVLALAAILVLAALIGEAHRISFRDDLTGIPNRRALNLRLRALGRQYTLAMLDVDHFKKFNDTYGHDTGDDVLKMVAARIARVGGGGLAYRYGGEEFTVVFPGRHVQDALPHLEALRESVAAYQLTVRDPKRPKDHKEGRKLRGKNKGSKSVRVTISIGAAQPDSNHRLPHEVIKAADEALYAAKKAGRNCVMAAQADGPS